MELLNRIFGIRTRSSVDDAQTNAGARISPSWDSVTMAINAYAKAHADGVVVYRTQADMLADKSQVANTAGLVLLDPDPSSNTTYGWDGHSWLRTFDRLSFALGNGSGFQGLLPGAELRPIGSKLGDVVNCRDYGCQLDGRTDDTAKLNQLAKSLGDAGGGTIVIPRGVLCASGIELPAGVVLEGEYKTGGRAYMAGHATDRHASVIKSTKAGDILILGPNSGVSGLAIYGAGAAAEGKGIYVPKDASFAFVKSVFIGNVADEALHVTSMASVVEDVLAFNSLLNRSRPALTGVVRLEGTDCFMNRVEANCSLNEVYGATSLLLCGIYVGGANHFISNCIGEMSERGIFVTSSGLAHRLLNCRADLNWGPGFSLGHGGSQFGNCTAANNARGKTAAGVRSGWEFAGSTGASLSNCRSICIDSFVGNHKFGFDLAAEGTRDDVRAISGRNVLDASCRSIGHKVASYNNTLAFPHAIDVPPLTAGGTGSTPSVDGTRQYVPEDTSATVITDFLGGVVGQHLLVEGNIHVTLEHGRKIFLKGGSDLRLTDNSMYEFVLSSRGRWIQV